MCLCQALGVDAMKLTLTQKDELVKLLLQYSDVFALKDDELGVTSTTQHTIDMGNCPLASQMDTSRTEGKDPGA